MRNFQAVPILTVLAVFLFFGCSNPKKPIAVLADAHHASIGAMTGTTGEQLVKARFPQATVKSFDDVMDAVAALKSNQLDAVITGYPAAMNVCKRNPDLTYLDEAVDIENTAIAVRKNETELLASLNNVIAGFTADGTLQEMRRRWFKMDLAPYEEVDVPQAKDGPVLKVGTSATREPFCYLDAQQKVTGHDGELARRIGAKLDRPIQFIDMKFSALIPALQSGKVDVIIAGMSVTEERRRSVDFTEPYFQNSQRLIVRKVAGHETQAGGQARKLRSQDDLKNARIGVLLGSVHDTWAMSHYPNATILQYKSPSELILAVRSGKIDAAIYTHETLLEILRADDQLMLLGDTLFSVRIGMGFNKENDALRLKFNEFFRKLRDDGTYNDMVRRWITNGETGMPAIPNPKTNGTLVVGYVSDKGLPFAVIKDNQVIGFDVEFAERFAAYLGKELKLADMEFGSLIAAAATNKIDMICSTLMITEQRKQQIDFSDEYMRLGASIFTLKSSVLVTNTAGTSATQASSVTEDSSTGPSLWQSIADSFQSNIIVEKRYLLILDGLKITAIIAVLSILFGTALGGVICWMRMSHKRMLVALARVYVSILRGTPVLVLLMIIFYVVFASVDIDPTIVAVVAFGLNFAAYVSEMYRTGIEGVDRGQTEAGIAMGFTKLQTFIHIVFPQAGRRILPVYKGEIISLVKMTSIVGYIAVQDLTKASDIIRSRTFDAFFPLIMVAVLYFLISWLLMVGLDSLDRATDPKLKSRSLQGGRP